MLRWLLLLCALAVVLVAPRARADQPGAHTVPVAVLALDSDDAEEQADALTGALRSRVRAAEGWSLIETTQSLSMLTAALKCPSRPPPDCQARIGEQLRAERYLWGFVAKSAGGQVTAELHLYQRGKPDMLIKESYAENLTDQNDDTLRKIASKIVDRIGGTAVGTVVVRAGSKTGEVIVDGTKRVPLANGSAKVDLSEGSHAIELAVPGEPANKRNVLVTAGKETTIDMASDSVASAPDGKPFPTKKVLGGVALALGVGAAVLAVERTAKWYGNESEAKDKAELFSGDPCNVGTNATPGQQDAARDVCQFNKDAAGISTVAWISGVAGAALIGTGVYFLFIDKGSSTEQGSPPPATARITPTAGPRFGGLSVVGTF
jgi:hypothetical protein